jgi:hypothetical protein
MRQRIEVLEEMMRQREEEMKSASSEVIPDDENGDGKSYDSVSRIIDLSADAPPSTLIPALASSTAPLHLRRSQLHSLLLHRSITQRKITRLESELDVERRANHSQLKSIDDQWRLIEQVKRAIEELEAERARGEEQARVLSQTAGGEKSMMTSAAEVSGHSAVHDGAGCGTLHSTPLHGDSLQARSRSAQSLLHMCSILFPDAVRSSVQMSSLSFLADASTSRLLLQLHTAESRMQRLEHENSAFTQRMYWRLLSWCIGLMVLSWLILNC